MKRKFLAFFVAAALLLMMTACGGEKPRTLRMNHTPSMASAVGQVMDAKGFLEKHLPEGVTVEWSNLATGPDMRDAIVSGNLDIADLALVTFIPAYENGLPILLLSHSAIGDVRVYSNDPEIRELSDLKPDSRIAITNKGTNLHAAFMAYCKVVTDNALMYDDNLVSIPAADALASLQTSDEFDAAIFSFPNLLKAEQIDGLSLLTDMSDAIAAYGVGSAYAVNSDFYEKNPDIVEAFLAAQQETIQFIREHSDEAAEILSEVFKVDSADIKDELQRIPPQMEIIGYDEQARLLYEAGILAQQPTPFAELPNYDTLPK